MKKVLFATTNKQKLVIAKALCHQAGVDIEQVVLEIDEIQGEDAELIVKDKARRAYEMIGKPVVVSDDSWDIPALKGFPGPYMKSINYWFTAREFLKLMEGIEDRTIILHQFLGYADGENVIIFKNDIVGKIIYESRGKNIKSPNMTIIVMNSDKEKTLAEVFNQGQDDTAKGLTNRHDVWHELIGSKDLK